MELIDLINHMSLARKSDETFTKNNLIVGEFTIARELLMNLTKEIDRTSRFLTKMKFVVEVQTPNNRVLQPIEKEVINDLCKHAGSSKTIIHESSEALTAQRALQLLK